MTNHTWDFTLKALKNGREWELQKQYSVLLTPGVYSRIEAGFIFNGASIPRLVWPLIGSPMTGKYVRAALVHDDAYENKRVFIGGQPIPIFRRSADDTMLMLMKRDEVWRWRRNTIYLAIRVGGQHAWKT